MEGIKTDTSGACRLISRVACSPVRFGIFTSRIARSGRSRIARSRASAPSAASATPSMSAWRSSSSRSPDRTIPWSSAISTLIGMPSPARFCRDGEADGGAGVGAGLDRQLAVDQERTLAHAADAEPAFGGGEGEAAAVVAEVAEVPGDLPRAADLALAEPLDQPGDRRRQAEVVERGGAEVAGEVEELAHRLVGERFGLGDLRLQLRRGRGARRLQS